MERGGKFFTTEELAMRVQNELALYERVRPAAVVIGFTMSAFISPRAAGIPLVSVNPFALTRPFFAARPTIWGEMLRGTLLGWLPEGLLNRLINGVGAAHPRLDHTDEPGGKAVRRAHLSPHSVDIFRGDYTLVTDIPQLTGVPELPDNWQYVGPIYARLAGKSHRRLPRCPATGPSSTLPWAARPTGTCCCGCWACLPGSRTRSSPPSSVTWPG
jgi:hypothetical protein